MSIAVTVSLDREVAIYLMGETIQVEIELKNTAAKGKESLAWGSVQLTCERTIGAQPALPDRPTTAMARNASTVFSSRPVVLFCDLQLRAGESRSFNCEVCLLPFFFFQSTMSVRSDPSANPRNSPHISRSDGQILESHSDWNAARKRPNQTRLYSYQVCIALSSFHFRLIAEFCQVLVWKQRQ